MHLKTHLKWNIFQVSDEGEHPDCAQFGYIPCTLCSRRLYGHGWRKRHLEKEYREVLAEKEKLQDELTERRRRSLMIGWFIDEVSGFEDLFTEFSENLWLGLVDVIVVVDKNKYRVKFKSGMEVPVEHNKKERKVY